MHVACRIFCYRVLVEDRWYCKNGLSSKWCLLLRSVFWVINALSLDGNYRKRVESTCAYATYGCSWCCVIDCIRLFTSIVDWHDVCVISGNAIIFPP